MSAKQRLIIASVVSLFATIALPLLILYVKKFSIASYIFSYIMCMAVMITFFLGGFSKLIINLIYTAVITGIVYGFKKFELIIIITGSILFVLNPLSFLENILKKKFNEENKIAIKYIVRDDLYIFYSYRTEMKKLFHKESLSLYNKNFFYHFLRNITSAIMMGFAVFVAFYKAVPYSEFMMLNYLEIIIISYIILILLFSSYLVKFKSFNSCFRFLNLFSIPLFLYYINTLKIDKLLKFSLLVSLFLILIILILIHVIFYFKRVAFLEYRYKSEKDGIKCVANALYEPYIYEKGYNLIGIYNIRCNKNDFFDLFNKFLIYSNFHQFIITGYKIYDGYIKLFCAFKNKAYNKPLKFSKYLASNLKTDDISINTIIDNDNLIYHEEFSQDPNYVIQRAIKSARFLREIQLRKTIIISLFFHFDKCENLLKFQEENLANIYELSNAEKVVETLFLSKNDDLKIEMLIRRLLFSATKNEGEYLRIVIKYPNKKIII